MSVFPVTEKDPEALLDYIWDWNDPADPYLAVGETLLTSVVTVPTGLTLLSQTHDTTTSTAWISGGTLGASYTVKCHITTSAGRADDRSITMNIVEK